MWTVGELPGDTLRVWDSVWLLRGCVWSQTKRCPTEAQAEGGDPPVEEGVVQWRDLCGNHKSVQKGRASSGSSAVPGHQEQMTMAPPPPRRLRSHPFIGQFLHPSLKGSEIKEQESSTSSKIVRHPASRPASWHPTPTPLPCQARVKAGSRLDISLRVWAFKPVSTGVSRSVDWTGLC